MLQEKYLTLPKYSISLVPEENFCNNEHWTINLTVVLSAESIFSQLGKTQAFIQLVKISVSRIVIWKKISSCTIFICERMTTSCNELVHVLCVKFLFWNYLSVISKGFCFKTNFLAEWYSKNKRRTGYVIHMTALLLMLLLLLIFPILLFLLLIIITIALIAAMKCIWHLANSIYSI